jgi:hypothetical protein
VRDGCGDRGRVRSAPTVPPGQHAGGLVAGEPAADRVGNAAQCLPAGLASLVACSLQGLLGDQRGSCQGERGLPVLVSAGPIHDEQASWTFQEQRFSPRECAVPCQAMSRGVVYEHEHPGGGQATSALAALRAAHLGSPAFLVGAPRCGWLEVVQRTCEGVRPSGEVALPRCCWSRRCAVASCSAFLVSAFLSAVLKGRSRDGSKKEAQVRCTTSKSALFSAERRRSRFATREGSCPGRAAPSFIEVRLAHRECPAISRTIRL